MKKTVYETLSDLLEEERQTLRFISHFGFISQESTRQNIAALEIVRDNLSVEDAEKLI